MERFVERYFRRRGEDPPAISDVVRQAFLRYTWPGNVRELENACERIAQTCTCGTVRVGCLAANILFRAAAEPPKGPVTESAAQSPARTTMPLAATPQLPPPMSPPPTAPQAEAIPVMASTAVVTAVPISLDDRLREVETSLIAWALKVSKGNKSRAAELLQVKRSTLGDRIKHCGLDEEHRRQDVQRRTSDVEAIG